MVSKALTADPGQAAAITLARGAPGFPALLAALTRIPHRAVDQLRLPMTVPAV
jgi:hypothetical protein